MKHAIIVAHPNPASFTLSVARAYEAAITAAGHSAVMRDLYAMQFDPRLAADEIPGAKGFAPHDDVKTERKLLFDVNVFAFVYPLWLNAPPAILKGYLDRVFGMGFAYGPVGGGTQQFLTGRTMISFTSSGAPEEWVKKTGAWDALRKLFDEHFAAVCGLDILDHVHFGGVVPGMRPDAVERLLEEMRAAVARHF
ncbi:MAG: NAD(P)H-dependent oxidoreductase [Rhizomicrobium sp.]